MPEQTDKRRSWWGILTPTTAVATTTNTGGFQSSVQGTLASFSNGTSSEKPTATPFPPGGDGGAGGGGGNGIENGNQTLRRVSSKLDLFKKGSRNNNGGTVNGNSNGFYGNNNGTKSSSAKGGKFATFTSAWTSGSSSSSRSGAGLSGRVSGTGSVSSSTMDLVHYAKGEDLTTRESNSNNNSNSSIFATGNGQQQQQYQQQQTQSQGEGLVFTVAEQLDLYNGERERDVAYSIRAEGLTQIILITRHISDFLEFDEKVRIQYPKSRPALPLLDDHRRGGGGNGGSNGNNSSKSSFLVSTRQFFFPRKNTAEKLEAYLRKVASHEPLRSSTIFEEFLSVAQEGDLVHSKELPRAPYKSNLNNNKRQLPVFPDSTSDPEVNVQKGSDDQNLSGSDHQGKKAHTFSKATGSAAATAAATTTLPPVPPQKSPSQAQSDKDSGRRDALPPKMRGGNKVRPGLPQIQENKKVSIDDFDLIKVLGKGCMGKVMLVSERKSKKLFALKAISKEWVILQREIEHTKSERNILAKVARISHPFLIKLRHSFQSNAQLFMVLDYFPGGDIATQLAQWHRFTPERCLFYAAEIVLGIEELHRQGIVYRDLKPENILLALDGHIVLTDFGLSKQFPSPSSYKSAQDKTNTFCGTAEYLAPEILLAAEYSYEVDWWSLGTLLYEMLTGITPYWAENHAQMYQRVLEDELEFPMDIDQDAASFISGLLERNPVHRLGYHGAVYVKQHAYFNNIDWERAIRRQLPCPYVPDLSSEEDLSNFDQAFLIMTPRLSLGDHTLSNSIQVCFEGYSYTDKVTGSTLPRNDSKIKLDRSSFKETGLITGQGLGKTVSTVKKNPTSSYTNRAAVPSKLADSMYIDDFDHDNAQAHNNHHQQHDAFSNGQSNGHGHGYDNGNSHVNGNGQEDKSNKSGNGLHQPLHRSPLQRMDTISLQEVLGRTDSEMEEDDFDHDLLYRGNEPTGDEESDDEYGEYYGDEYYEEDGDDVGHDENLGFYRGRPLTQIYSPPMVSAYSPPSAAISAMETKAQATSPTLTPPTSHSEDGRMERAVSSTSRTTTAADILRGFYYSGGEREFKDNDSKYAATVTSRRTSRSFE